MTLSRMLPPRLFLLLAAVTGLFGTLVPGWRRTGPPTALLGAVLVLAGLALSVAGSRTFARIGTNIKTFDDPTALVTTGLYARTRNPMYLGFTVALLGEAVLVGAITALVGPLGFFLAAQWHYIPFEEKRMRAVFGSAFGDYASRVRRWL
jgi:protein-S-isoprenylcysteine O-methyltransferase Ste14